MKDIIDCCIPLPLQIVIDDVGWWSGEDGSKKHEPYRTGFIRDHVPADYQAIADLGSKLGMRPQAAMILGEWAETKDISSIPSCSKSGKGWNPENCNKILLEKTSNIIQSNQANIEITLHGISHEYWKEDTFTRGEWYDQNGKIRPIDECLQRLELFKKIMYDNLLGLFPESYVPTAFVDNFSPNKENFLELFKKYGIKYISTPFSTMLNAKEVKNKYYGIDNGIITIDRGQDLMQWNKFNVPIEGEVSGPICGMHWPNILHEDPARNNETVDLWVNHLKKYQLKLDRMLSKNTKEMCSQLVYHQQTLLSLNSNTVDIESSKIPEDLIRIINNSFFIKIDTDMNASFEGRNLEIVSQEYTHEGGHHVLEVIPHEDQCALIIK
ncbi:MAG: hypothetical protein COA79_18120 [Planctomycetota bacterium]|nr:MAG: hypothetical protein COA79_18120 [Planctomycetota bacterium]